MQGRRPSICVGVPVWHGADVVGETLESVLRQREVDLTIFISVDGPDEPTEKSCRPFLADSRVRLVIQPARLGWARNSAVVLAAAAAFGAGYGCVQPHDDVVKEGYLATLLEVAERSPAAAVVYSDIEVLGTPERKVVQHSVTGSPMTRQLDLLANHFNAVAWRGLTRVTALSRVSAIGRAAFGDFAADTVWMARLARAGELIRVPEALYKKRFTGKGAHEEWRTWPQQRKMQAWTEHCLAMLDEALPVAADADDRRNLIDAARLRLLESVRPLDSLRRELTTLTPPKRAQMLAAFDAALEQ